jgi:hypothetical protein
MIGAAPILTQVAWSKGKYDSYVLKPDGLMIGTVHPPGLAWIVNTDDNNMTIPNEMSFLSSRNQCCWGRWFVAALLPCPFQCLNTGSSFQCQLILVMGANATASKSLMKRDVNIYYYKMREDLGNSAITNLFASQPNPKQFVTNLFESSISVGSEETTRRIRLLNQISGPSLAGWNLSDCTTVVDGITYYQCRKGPDQWLKRAPMYNNNTELRVGVMKPQYTLWGLHPLHQRHYINDNLSIITGTRNLTQFRFRGTDVIITYSTKKETYGKYMWMPLPQSPTGLRNFALITI